MRAFNDKVTTPHLKYDDDRLSASLNKVRANLAITYRNIQICHTRAAYDIDTLVEYVNANVPNPLQLIEGTVCEPLFCVVPQDRQTICKARSDKKITEKKMIQSILEIIQNDEINDENCLMYALKISKDINLVDLAETFIKAGPDYDEYSSILHHSCAYFKYSLLKHLLDIGVDINLLTPDARCCPLYVLCSSTYKVDETKSENVFACIELLINNEVKLDPYYFSTLNGEFIVNNEQGIIHIIKLAIQNGMSLRTSTILCHVAVVENASDVIKSLVALGADVNFDKNKKYYSPLISICYKLVDHPELNLLPNIQTLLELGANINITTSSNITVLGILLKSKNPPIEIIEYLLKSGITKTLCSSHTLSIDKITNNQDVIDLYNKY